MRSGGGVEREKGQRGKGAEGRREGTRHKGKKSHEPPSEWGRLFLWWRAIGAESGAIGLVSVE